MLSHQIIINRLSDFLSDKETLALRATSKKSIELFRNNQQAPYVTKISFTMAVSGIFYDKKYFDRAWRIYYSVINSTTNKAAILYKLTDYAELIASGEMAQVAEGENLSMTGRLYSPFELHVWSINEIWIKAVLDKHTQSFVIYSKLCWENMQRRKKFTEFSAFAREIATIMQEGSGYSLKIAEDIERLQLSPDPQAKKQSLNPKTMTVSKEHIVKSVDAVIAMDKKRQNILSKIKAMHRLFESIFEVSGHAHKLEKLKNSITGEISKLIDTIFLDNQITANSFILVFNKTPGRLMTLCLEQSSLRFFNENSAIAKIKNDLTTAAIKKIDTYLEDLTFKMNDRVIDP